MPGTFTGRGVLRIGVAVVAAGSLLLLTVALCAAAGIAIPVTGLSTVGPGAPDLLVAGIIHFLINIGLLVVLDEESGNAAPEIAFGVAAVVVAGCAVTFRYLYIRVR